MSNLFTPTVSDRTSMVGIPDILRPLSAVVVARLSPGGMLVDCNNGFVRLIGGTNAEAGRDVTAFFINPTLGEFLETGSSAPHGMRFEGILTLGDPETQCQSMRGAIWQDPGGFLLVAEYDVDHMEQLASSVLELNNELTDLQRQLSRQNIALKRSHDRIHTLSLTDTLTEIPNRRAFNDRLRSELERSARTGIAFGLIMCDIDHFKHVNDHFGHDIGDVVLKSTASHLGLGIRPYDLLARIGGEEFVVIMPDADRNTLLNAAERLRSMLSSHIIPEIHGAVTISLGATLWQSGDTAQTVFHRADRAVYSAKDSGRNCVREA